MRSEPGLANAPQPGLVGRGDNDAAHMMQQEREADIKKPLNVSEGAEKHSGEGAWGELDEIELPELLLPPARSDAARPGQPRKRLRDREPFEVYARVWALSNLALHATFHGGSLLALLWAGWVQVAFTALALVVVIRPECGRLLVLVRCFGALKPRLPEARRSSSG